MGFEANNAEHDNAKRFRKEERLFTQFYYDEVITAPLLGIGVS